MAAKKRTTLRSSRGWKLYAKRNDKGQFEDIQTYKRAHGSDVQRVSKAETAARKKARKPARKMPSPCRKPDYFIRRSFVTAEQILVACGVTPRLHFAQFPEVRNCSFLGIFGGQWPFRRLSETLETGIIGFDLSFPRRF